MRHALAIVPLLLLFAACSGNEIVGIHIALQKDGPALVTTRALVDAPQASPIEVTTGGATWTKRASLVYSRGEVAKLEDLKFGDDGGLKFFPRLDAEPRTVRVRVQRGASSGWLRALTPQQGKRRELAGILDPRGKTVEIGDVVRLEIAGLTDANSSSVLPSARGVEAGRDGNRAWLLLPVETILDGGEELVWDISWK